MLFYTFWEFPSNNRNVPTQAWRNEGGNTKIGDHVKGGSRHQDLNTGTAGIQILLYWHISGT